MVDQVARDKARDAAHDLRNHIQVTGIKLDNLDKKIETGQTTLNQKLDGTTKTLNDKLDENTKNLNQKIDTTHQDTNTKIDRLESILKWAGGLIVMLFISTLTWSLAQQYNANESTKKDLSAQVELLRTQQQNSAIAKSERQQILSRLPASTTQPADASGGGGQ